MLQPEITYAGDGEVVFAVGAREHPHHPQLYGIANAEAREEFQGLRA